MCNCSRIKFCLGNITYIFERLASCCALTSVVTCIMTTLLIMLAIGVGLGYNYCYVDYETGRHREENWNLNFPPVDSHVTTSSTTNTDNTTTVTTSSITTTDNKATTTGSPPRVLRIAPTIITSLRKGINFPRLIDEIRKGKNNVTLELIV